MCASASVIGQPKNVEFLSNLHLHAILYRPNTESISYFCSCQRITISLLLWILRVRENAIGLACVCLLPTQHQVIQIRHNLHI